MNTRLLLAIIKLTTLNSVSIDKIAEFSRIPINILRKTIGDLAEDALLNLDNGVVETSLDQRLKLAIVAIKEGVDVEWVCRALGWREFEDIAVLTLEHNDFKTLKHFRFKSPSRRYEIDILGIKGSLILSIDCKHWKRPVTKKAINNHVERTIALIHSLPGLKTNVTSLVDPVFIPVMVTLSEASNKFSGKVPLVPIFQLQDFLYEMAAHKDQLLVLKEAYTDSGTEANK